MKVMKRYIVALIYMALCMPLVSCDKEVQEQYGDSSAYLPISDMENLYPLGYTAYVSFTSDSEWRLTTRDEATKKEATWLSFKNCTRNVKGKFGGVGTTDLEITIDPYIDEDKILEKTAPREATIIFHSKTGDKEFKVFQERAYFKIVESNDSTSDSNDINDNISFDWKKEQRKYEVESNFNWKLNINDGSVDNATVKVNDSEWNSNTLYGIDTNELSVDVDYNFSGTQNNVISFIPCLNDGAEAKKEQYNVLRRKLNVIQDYLYLKVVDSSIDPTNPNNLTTKKAFENLSELGDEEVSFYVVYQENLKDNYDINIDDNSYFEYYEADGNNSGKCSVPNEDGRNIYWKKYSAKFTKANPDFVNKRTITCDIKPHVEEDVPEACLRVEFVQNAYEFNVKDGAGTDVTEKEINNEGGSESFTLTTKGDWKISYPKAVNDWAELTFRDQEGNTINCELKSDVFEVSQRGNVTIDVTVKNRNLSFDHDNLLELELVALDIKDDYPDEIDPTKNVNLKQPKFEFGIFVNNGTKETNENFNVSSHTTKEYPVRIESSGSWKIVEDSDWVEFIGDKEKEGDAIAGNLKFDNNLDDVKPRSFVLKVISKEHAEVADYKNNYFRELIITQDEIKKNILEYDGGPSLIDKTLSRAAYKAEDADRQSSFYMQCSAPWTLADKPEWITLRNESGELEIGKGVDNGEYSTISLEVENNLDSQIRSGKVSFSVGGKKIGFNVNQDGFVFDVPSFSKTYDPIPTGDPDEFEITLTNEAELDLNDIDSVSWVNFTYDIKESNDKTTTYKCSIKPAPNVETLNKDRGRDYNIGVSGESLTKSITIKQKKFEWALNKEKLDVFDVIRGESSQSVSIKQCTMEGSKRCYDVVFDECDWLELSNSKTGDKSLTFKTKSTNTSTTERRSGKIIFYVKHSSIDSSKRYVLSEINVEQEKYTWNVDCDKDASFKFEPVYSDNESYKGKIQIKSSGSWRVDTYNKDMLQLSSTSGTGDKDLTFTIKPNYTDDKRSVDIKIINDDLGETETKTITLNQNAYILEATPNPIELESTKGSSQSIAIKTSANDSNWSFTQDEESKKWLTVNKNEGNLYVETKSKNATKKERSATIIVTDNTSRRDITIEVTQKG